MGVYGRIKINEMMQRMLKEIFPWENSSKNKNVSAFN